MTDTTIRLALPLIVPGQAQKELFHNEALAAIDLALQASVVAVGVDAPPSAPALGDCWIVGAAPTGDWASHGNTLAGWTEGGWRFVAPVQGMAVWDRGSGQVARWLGSGWVVGAVTAAKIVIGGVQVVGAQRAPIAAPAGGATVDAEARATLGAVLSALRAHGLVAP